METKEDITIHVRLTPKAAQNRIQGWEKDANGADYLKIQITTAPEQGKANKALINFLAKTWGIPKSHIHITKGATNRNKTLLIKDLSPVTSGKILP